jgi:hypothetical protein
MSYPKITVFPNYQRPYLEMPNPNSSKGNPIEYFPLALDCLKKTGFKKEFEELMHYGKAIIIATDKIAFQIPYNEQMNFLSYFLEVDTTAYLQEEIDNSDSENDDEFFYIKKRKNKITQNKIFKINTISEIQKLIYQKHDFGIVNNYQRLHIHYINDFNSIELLIKENEHYNWFSLFHLDVFNSTLLHGRDMKSFNFILSKMYEKDSELTNNYLFGVNIFQENALTYFLKEFDIFIDKFNQYNDIQKFQKDFSDSIKNFSNIIKTIYNLNPSFYDKFISQFDILIEKNKNYKDFKTLMFVNILDSDLNQKNFSKKTNKI